MHSFPTPYLRHIKTYLSASCFSLWTIIFDMDFDSEISYRNFLPTLQDEQCISHGERFADAVKSVIKSDQLVAVGLNCCPPDIVSSLLATVEQNKRPKGGWIVYPNSGEKWNPNT